MPDRGQGTMPPGPEVGDHGVPDAGRRTPDAGRRTPDAGRGTPDAGRRTPVSGVRGNTTVALPLLKAHLRARRARRF